MCNCNFYYYYTRHGNANIDDDSPDDFLGRATLDDDKRDTPNRAQVQLVKCNIARAFCYCPLYIRNAFSVSAHKATLDKLYIYIHVRKHEGGIVIKSNTEATSRAGQKRK